MTNQQNLWLRRWEAIDNNISILQDRYDAFNNEDSARREQTIFTLLRQLQKFGAGQFRFFHDGFYTKKFVELEPIPDTPDFAQPEFITGYPIQNHILYNTLEQITEDAVVIQRASEQRFMSQLFQVFGLARNAKFGNTLTSVDQLAYSALRMVGGYLHEPQQTVLTYFRRSANVRVIPYAPVAMVGIPITATGLNFGIGVTEDLLAIPHEIAHHLYWNGRTGNDERIHTKLAELAANSPARHWTEEIFADVVGCLIGGPAMARSFIEMQLTTIGSEFLHHDQTHPTPSLRPLIHAYVLEKMGLNSLADVVRDQWNAHLIERMTFADRTLLYAAFDVVDQVLSIIPPDQLSSNLRWTNGDSGYDSLYTEFNDRITNLSEAVSDNDLDPVGQNLDEDWLERVKTLADDDKVSNLNLPNEWPSNWDNAAALAQKSGTDPVTVDAETWLQIYDLGGWITAGPKAGHGTGGG